MMVDIKSESDIRKMRVAGRLASEVLEMIEEHVVPGVTTGLLDEICHNYIVQKQNAIPAPLNYKGFPKSICTSINHQVCHGIPSKEKKLKEGDIINIDVTVIKDEFHGDTSKMFFVGKTSVLAKRLCEITKECMMKAINLVKPGLHLGDIGAIIEEHATKHNFSVVRDYCGHGIGKKFHELPQILHYGTKNTGMKLEEGMTFTIEPMINSGGEKTRLLGDGWTVVTQDHSLSAQYEHTILVTSNGYEVLTIRNEEKGLEFK
ncbi:MAG: type I methionyl aminopeptidase [Pseudomonadota bacterium]|nr:type I methionyl aminopeptidase [Pseudomonadota bacterium]